MAALQPPAGGQVPHSSIFLRKSFADLFSEKSSIPSLSIQATPFMHKGEPAILFSQDALDKLAAPYRFVLVGKFSRGRPKLEDIRTFLLKLDLCEAVTVGLLDPRHVLLRFHNEADFHRCWSRGIWYVHGSPMRVFKWSPAFHVDREPSVVPMWFQLPKLPLHFFHKEALFQLVGVLGIPLLIDTATVAVSRPSVARVCVEVDLLKPRPSRIWIGNGEHEGFWQELVPENIPTYCSHCYRQGHMVDECHVQNPSLRTKKTGGEMQEPGHPRVGFGSKQWVEVQDKEAAKNLMAEGGTPVQPVVAVNHARSTGKEAADLGNILEPAAVETQVVDEAMPPPPNSSVAVVPEDGADAGLQISTSNPLEEGKFTDPGSDDEHSIHPTNDTFTEAALEEKAMEASNYSQKVNGITSAVAKGSFSKIDQVNDPRDIVSGGDPTLVGTSTRTRTETKSSLPQNPVRQFKDVFEEVKWEKLHGTVPRPHEMLFIRSSITCNDDKNEEEEDDSQRQKDKDQDQNLVQEQFTQVISKKSRKQLSKKGKTMQTRQDVKSNSHAHSQTHKCGAPSCG